MWRVIGTTARQLLINILGISSLLLAALCLIAWLTAVVVLTGTWITAVAAVTGAIAIIAAPPALVFSAVVRTDREHQERRKRKRKAEKRSRAARALPITPDHAAP